MEGGEGGLVCANVAGVEKDQVMNGTVPFVGKEEALTTFNSGDQVDKKLEVNGDVQVKINGFMNETDALEEGPKVNGDQNDSLYKTLEALCLENISYFQNDQTEKGQRLHAAFTVWVDYIEKAEALVRQIEAFAHEYDFDADTPGNGYRSFVTVTTACVEYGLRICKELNYSRGGVLFRKKLYMKEVESCSQLLASLCTCLEYLLILREWSPDGDLFVDGGEHTAEELFEKGDTINQYCFYGRCLGFQYGNSIRGVLRFISISMAGFSESFYSEQSDGRIAKTTRSVWTGGKYFLNPELRARRIVNISQNASIEFCKSFWFLSESELMHTIPSIVGTSIKINKVIEIPPEPLTFVQNSDTHESNPPIDIEIPIPTSHLGPGGVSVRLLSSNRREGMIGESSRWRRMAPPSPNLLFHCHGGGFVAQSSKSHELYLRDWAVALDCPILSVDYSLAPEAPFPRAIEEAFYAYCWALKNCGLLGWTGERIIMAGDSAGANLCIGVTLKSIEMGIRKPDGLFIAYCPVLVSFVPSPARLLCLMDPLLPFGFMMRCLKAYASPSPGVNETNKTHRDAKQDVLDAAGSNIALSLDSSLADNSHWEHIRSSDIAAIPISSPAASDDTCDTFASASYHSQTVEKTELLTPGDTASCVSFESDSQPIVHVPINETALRAQDSVDSEQYIDRFIDKYVIEPSVEARENDRPTMKQTIPKTLSEENLFIETGKDVIAVDSIHARLNNAVYSLSNTLNKYITSSEIKPGFEQDPMQNLRNLDALIARSPSAEFAFQVPKDPYLSPYWAADDHLRQFPNTKILTVDMDPCLDDCVMFAKKLKNLGSSVSLTILKGLPHGFLNFTMLSSEAMDGSKQCITLLADLFKA